MFSRSAGGRKAVKALLIKHGVEFPYVHDLAELLTLLEQKGIVLPEIVKQGEKLTRFAVFTRYPGIASPVSHEEYEEALNLAKEIVHWVKGQIES